MRQSQISSTPCASEEEASAQVNSMILALGKDVDVEIVSIDTKEVDGVFIATAIVRVKDLEENPDEGAGDSQAGARENAAELPNDLDPDALYLHGHIASAGVKDLDGPNETPEIPDEDAVPHVEPESYIILPPDNPENANADKNDSEAQDQGDEIITKASEQVEDLTQEFELAETADGYIVDGGPVLSAEEIEAEQERDEREAERRRLIAIEQLEEMNDADAPVPDPAQAA